MEALSGSALTPPAGMRDLLPPESRARRRVSERLQGVFERFGYELVTTPLFEHEEVFERGLALDPRDLLRFVEPDSGEVAALRPDITPQIARVVSTRLAEYPPPFRIRYEGTVIRRRRGRARRQRQIAQVGVELIGVAGAEADVEMIRLMAEACESVGLVEYRLELSDVSVARALLGAHGDRLLARSAEALARKDDVLLTEILREAGLPEAARARISALTHLHGDLDVLQEAQALLANTAAAGPLSRLAQVAQRVVESGLGDRVGVDLGEIRGLAYYTGVSFSVFAPGPGEALAGGGRYDQLLERYGMCQPATGAAIDLENLLWALDHAGHAWRERTGTRFLLTGQGLNAQRAVQRTLHAAGHVAATLPGADRTSALAYARAWAYDIVLQCNDGQLTAARTRDAQEREIGSDLSTEGVEALVAWAGTAQKE